MKIDRSIIKYVLMGVLITVASAAGLRAESVTLAGELRGELRGELDTTELHTKLDTIDAKLDRVLDHLAAPPDNTPPQDNTPGDGGDDGGGDDPGSGGSDLWMNVSFYRYTPVVEYDDATNSYRVTDPRFVELMSQFGGIRYMDWMALKNTRVSSSWSDRPTHEDVARWDSDGVPLEAIIAVANATKTHVWLSVPSQWDDDYLRRAGELFARTLDPSLRVVLEDANEVWDQGRGWYYHRQANGDDALRFKLYAEGAAAKFKAFVAGGFPPDRLTRVIGGQLSNIGVLKTHALKHISPDQFDAITVSGYFANNTYEGEHWRTGKHGLIDAMGYLEGHARLAESIGKPLILYEVHSHVTGDLQLFNSDDVIDGVQTMIDKARLLGVPVIALYSGPGRVYDTGPWPSYTTDYQPRAPAKRLGWPTIHNN